MARDCPITLTFNRLLPTHNYKCLAFDLTIKFQLQELDLPAPTNTEIYQSMFYSVYEPSLCSILTDSISMTQIGKGKKRNLPREHNRKHGYARRKNMDVMRQDRRLSKEIRLRQTLQPIHHVMILPL
jgi:hypothetical protein